MPVERTRNAEKSELTEPINYVDQAHRTRGSDQTTREATLTRTNQSSHFSPLPASTQRTESCVTLVDHQCLDLHIFTRHKKTASDSTTHTRLSPPDSSPLHTKRQQDPNASLSLSTRHDKASTGHEHVEPRLKAHDD